MALVVVLVFSVALVVASAFFVALVVAIFQRQRCSNERSTKRYQIQASP